MLSFSVEPDEPAFITVPPSTTETVVAVFARRNPNGTIRLSLEGDDAAVFHRAVVAERIHKKPAAELVADITARKRRRGKSSRSALARTGKPTP